MEQHATRPTVDSNARQIKRTRSEDFSARILPAEINVRSTVYRLLPELAVEIGFHEALILTQLEYLIHISNAPQHPSAITGEMVDWTYQSVNDWVAMFPFLGRSTLHRALQNLTSGTLNDPDAEHRYPALVEVGSFNKKGYDRTKWYSIKWDALKSLKSIFVRGELFGSGV